MIYVILVLIVIALIVVYIKGLIAMPFMLWFFAGYIGLMILCIIGRAICKAKNSFSAAQQRQLEDAAKIDSENQALNEKSAAYAAAQRDNEIQQIEAEYEQKLMILQMRENEAELNIAQMDVLAESDCNVATVDALLQLLSSRRANNLTEALNRYDDLHGRRH